MLLDSEHNLAKILGMSRNRSCALLLLIAGLALMLAAGCAGLGRMLRGAAYASYFPLAVGNEWEYRLVTTAELNGKLDTTTVASYSHRIEGTRKLTDGKPVLMSVRNSTVTLRSPVRPESTFQEAETTCFRTTKHAAYRYSSLDSPPDSILLLPIEMDRKWNSSGTSYWVAAREDVKVDHDPLPDRTFSDCWRIRMTDANDPTPSVAWFARGLGLVRMVTERTFGNKKIHTDYYLVRAQIN